MLSSLPAPRSKPPAWSDLSEHEMLAKQFRVVRFLGAGPEGTALAATRVDGGAPVELRFVQEHAQTDLLLERWSRYQLLDHPHIISLQQVEYAGGDWCAVLDTAQLGNLEQALAEPWSPNACLSLLAQLSGALAAAHEVGLWHGNLTPAMIYLDAARGVRLEFTGVSVGATAALPASPDTAWQTRDQYDDLLQLALIAERVFGDTATAHARLPWLVRLQDEDACRRPDAAELIGLLREGARDARVAAERWQLQTLDTERPRAAAPELRAEARTLLGQPGVGERVGRFRLEQLLGQGGMGSVYRAVDVASGQVVAVKLLRPELLGDEGVRYRFKKEARVLKAVQSPYVANLVEADLSDTLGYIALEFINGQDLAGALDEHREALPETLALQIVADLCRALVEPHRRGIVHRDIKPQNVLLVGDLKVPGSLSIKLCDFGIASARLSADTVGMTQDGRLWGTPQYMAPEQCKAAPVSPATDVYALGLTLYELIAGRPAFEADDLMQVLRRQLSEDPPRLSERAAVSEGTSQLVARALDKQAARRFADATELLAAIEQVRSGPVQTSALAVQSRAEGAQQIEFSLELRSAAHDLWPYVSDTDRMNQVIGLPPVEVERVSGEGATRTFLSNKVLGMSLRWQEYPFEWVEGHRWSVLRVFESGLMRWYRVTLELEPLPAGGTRLSYRMAFEPRWPLLGFLVRFEVGVKQKAQLLRVFQRVDTLLEQGSIRRTPSPHAAPRPLDSRLARQVSKKLQELESAGVDTSIVEALRQHVLYGAEAEIARLRPLRFARSHGLPERAFTEACLLAAHGGLFDLMWDVICPLCQIPASFAESLQRLESHARCPACELSFPLQFADSVELVFRVSPEVRPNELAAYCIGGPAHSPHVAAQLRLGPGEGQVLSLALADGRHRVRSTELPGVLVLDVSSQHAFARADLVIGTRLRAVKQALASNADPRLTLEASEPTIHVASGVQTLGLRNELPHEVTVRVERSAEREDALSAARAWAMPKFRELFPGETLESGRLVAVGQLSFLALRVVDHLGLIERLGDAAALAETVRVFDRLQVIAEEHHGRLASSSMDLGIAAFERPGDALAACLEIWRALGDPSLVGCSLALHRGPAVATSIDDRMAYYGRTLARTLELTVGLEPRLCVVSSAALGEDAAQLGAQPDLTTRLLPAPRLGPAAWCLQLERGGPPVSARLLEPQIRQAESSLLELR
ncbi:MAG TPA: protein kinase [Polyangiaceae bacterium]|nr:protein kinase [Polyangiaceae bacterium]